MPDLHIDIEHDIRSRETVVLLNPRRVPGQVHGIVSVDVRRHFVAHRGVELRFTYEDLQDLIDTLWRTGHRPSPGVLTAAEAVRAGQTPSPGPTT